ncbi:sorbin and SH3 domain-containing protein 1 isoform X45, partial [Biomphalaria glabrata]
GQLPRGAQYIASKETIDGGQRISDTYYTSPAPTDTNTTQVVTEVKPVKYDGIGPVDREGIPLGFRK